LKLWGESERRHRHEFQPIHVEVAPEIAILCIIRRSQRGGEKMKAKGPLALFWCGVSLAVVLAGAAEKVRAQAQTPTPTHNAAQSAAPAATQSSPQASAQAGIPGAAQTAEQKYKNIQILKGIPADQLVPSMQFIAASLGVQCEFCHVERDRGSDEKKPKLVARKMITMMMQINADNFKGERVVTCYSCHRGAVRPVGTPILSSENIPTAHLHAEGAEEESPAATALPAAQAILDKYLAAVGGADAVQSVRTRVQTGNIEVADKKFSIEVYSQAPNKRVSTSHMTQNASVTAYNGETGWLSTPNGIRQMSPAELQAASIDAQLYFPVWLPKAYQQFKVEPGEAIEGKATYLVAAIGKDEVPLDLYFDQQSGLLVRLIRYAETPLGRNPTQIDYADFRAVDGFKIPYRWTLARPNGRFTIQIDDVKQNVPVDEKLFVLPSIPAPHQSDVTARP
jgi:photosynthetic reaction center cytochrome c subunit